MLISGRELFKRAKEGSYAIGGFNVCNMEFVQAVIKAAEVKQSPVILQVSQGVAKYAGITTITEIVKAEAAKTTIPVVLHLDHGTDYEVIMQCLRAGFTSIMIDASRYELDENIRVTREIANACHAMNVGVEAELGKIHGVEDEIAVDEKDASFTDPQEAIRFVKETGVDALAIAVGTAHGPYKGKPELDFERIQTIKQLVDAAIVLHGSSGVGEEDIRRAVELGVNKFNIDTDLRQAFDATLRDFVTQNPAVYDPKKIIGVTRPAIQRVAETKIALFGSSKKAW